MLCEERAYYDEQLPSLLSRFPGRFVLIRGRELVGAYDTQEEALREGARRFGLTPFLVRCVEQSQPEIEGRALTLGQYGCKSQYTLAV